MACGNSSTQRRPRSQAASTAPSHREHGLRWGSCAADDVDAGQFMAKNLRVLVKAMAMKLHDLRADYDRDELREEHLRADPFEQFAVWMKEACESKLVEPNAMSLATVGAEGQPTQRTV